MDGWWRWTGRALLAMALGHAASLAIVAGTAVLGAAMKRETTIALAGGLLAFLMAARLRRHRTADLAAPAAHAGLALCTFSIATVQGAGLVLVPALVPLCVGSGASGGTGRIGPLGSALVAIGLHLAAMLATTAAVAGGIAAIGRWLSSRARPRRAGPF